MITIERTDQDGTIYINLDQATHEDLIDFYANSFDKEIYDHGDTGLAAENALIKVIEYSINVFMFDNRCIRPIRTPNRKRKKR